MQTGEVNTARSTNVNSKRVPLPFTFPDSAPSYTFSVLMCYAHWQYHLLISDNGYQPKVACNTDSFSLRPTFSFPLGSALAMMNLTQLLTRRRSRSWRAHLRRLDSGSSELLCSTVYPSLPERRTPTSLIIETHHCIAPLPLVLPKRYKVDLRNRWPNIGC